MATEDYQANYKGARRYQFDEEARRKAAARRRAEGITPSTRIPWTIVTLCAGVMFAAAYLI